MIASAQIRAARALLRWSAQDLADAAGVSMATIQRMEAIDGVPMGRVQTLVAVTGALEKGGVEFISRNGGGPGVRLRDPE
jgi:transcriptional regulator with XRE-family HTH domain